MPFKVSRIQLFSALFVLALIAGIAALVLSARSPSVSAAEGPKADVTFTKWVTQATTFPWDMIGVVGGDVGTGTFTGEVLHKFGDGTTSAIYTAYHFEGGKHSFTAHLYINQTDATGAGVVVLGVVTDGWLKGSQVTGGFDRLPLVDCGIPTPGNLFPVCFKGTLHLGPKF